LVLATTLVPSAALAAPGQIAEERRPLSAGARGIVVAARPESLGVGFGASGIFLVPVTPSVDVEGEVGFLTMESETGELPAGRLAVFPLRGTLRVRVGKLAGADFYAGGGGGVYLSRFSLDEQVERELAVVGFAASASIDSTLGLHAAGGLEWTHDRIHFGVDLKYVVGEANAPSAVLDLVSSEGFSEASTLDLNGLWISAGARFDFQP
jgi:hypothetical protein